MTTAEVKLLIFEAFSTPDLLPSSHFFLYKEIKTHPGVVWNIQVTDMSDMLYLPPEHTGHRHAQGEKTDAALQQRQRGRDAGVLRAGERRRRAQQTHLQASQAPG